MKFTFQFYCLTDLWKCLWMWILQMKVLWDCFLLLFILCLRKVAMIVKFLLLQGKTSSFLLSLCCIFEILSMLKENDNMISAMWGKICPFVDAWTSMRLLALTYRGENGYLIWMLKTFTSITIFLSWRDLCLASGLLIWIVILLISIILLLFLLLKNIKHFPLSTFQFKNVIDVILILESATGRTVAINMLLYLSITVVDNFM